MRCWANRKGVFSLSTTLNIHPNIPLASDKRKDCHGSANLHRWKILLQSVQALEKKGKRQKVQTNPVIPWMVKEVEGRCTLDTARQVA